MRRHLNLSLNLVRILTILTSLTSSTPTPQPSLHPTPPSPQPLSLLPSPHPPSPNITTALFASLEQLSRIVDITYCLGATGTGISTPFQCASRCDEFPGFELVGTWNTGVLLSDSCGFLVLDHGKGDEGESTGGRGNGGKGRVIVAFRGTYSVANTIVDLSTVPQEYVPYPDPGNASRSDDPPEKVECTNCTVHTGFWTSWQNTRPFVLPHLKTIREKYPHYKVELVGHSLGGAVAALAGLEFEALGWEPVVTTFGEPRVGNEALRDYIDEVFELKAGGELLDGRYRRVTHVDDPVPLLPLQEWGYWAHAGEIYISKPELQPGLHDIRLCFGDEDPDCIAGADADGSGSWFEKAAAAVETKLDMDMDISDEQVIMLQKRWGIPIPARYKMWQLFFAHRDYFWRLGLCVPGGDPFDWGRDKYDFGDGDGDGDQVQIEL